MTYILFNKSTYFCSNYYQKYIDETYKGKNHDLKTDKKAIHFESF